MKSVTFGKTTVYEIENISDYLRVQTFPDVLGKVEVSMLIMIEQLCDNENLTISERLLLMENRMVPMAMSLVENRDVLSVNIQVLGVRSNFIPEDMYGGYNRSMLLSDFTGVVASAFGKYKNVEIEYGKDKTVMTFDVSPYPSLDLDISNL